MGGVRVDLAALPVEREQDRALETVASGQNPGQHWQGLLRTILLVPADQDDVFAGPGPTAASQDEPGPAGLGAERAGQEQRQQQQKSIHGCRRDC